MNHPPLASPRAVEPGPGRRPSTPRRRLAPEFLPLGVVLLGLAWGRLAWWRLVETSSAGPLTRWGVPTTAAASAMLVLGVAAIARGRPRWPITLRCGMAAAMFALILIDPFIFMENTTQIFVATAVVVAMTIAIRALAGAGATGAAAALSVFVASMVASVYFNAGSRWVGIGFFGRWSPWPT